MSEVSDYWKPQLKKANDTIDRLSAIIAAQKADNEQQRAALKAVEAWWLSEGVKHFTGAPYAIFAVREALGNSAANGSEGMTTPMECPNCKANLDGGPIPENIREHYSPPYRWSKAISVVDGDLDEHVRWRCPRCKHEWR